MRILAALMAATLLGFVLQVHPQAREDSRGSAVYKVEFDIRDSSDLATQSRQHFSMLIDESRKGAFQAANRVPVTNGSSQYIDVGVNIECSVHESDGKVALHGDIELTRITGQVNLSGISQPIVGQRKMAFDETVLLSSPTVIIGDRNALAANPAILNRRNAPVSGKSQAESPPIAATHQVQATVTKVD